MSSKKCTYDAEKSRNAAEFVRALFKSKGEDFDVMVQESDAFLNGLTKSELEAVVYEFSLFTRTIKKFPKNTLTAIAAKAEKMSYRVPGMTVKLNPRRRGLLRGGVDAGTDDSGDSESEESILQKISLYESILKKAQNEKEAESVTLLQEELDRLKKDLIRVKGVIRGGYRTEHDLCPEKEESLEDFTKRYMDECARYNDSIIGHYKMDDGKLTPIFYNTKATLFMMMHMGSDKIKGYEKDMKNKNDILTRSFRDIISAATRHYNNNCRSTIQPVDSPVVFSETSHFGRGTQNATNQMFDNVRGGSSSNNGNNGSTELNGSNGSRGRTRRRRPSVTPRSRQSRSQSRRRRLGPQGGVVRGLMRIATGLMMPRSKTRFFQTIIWVGIITLAGYSANSEEGFVKLGIHQIQSGNCEGGWGQFDWSRHPMCTAWKTLKAPVINALNDLYRLEYAGFVKLLAGMVGVFMTPIITNAPIYWIAYFLDYSITWMTAQFLNIEFVEPVVEHPGLMELLHTYRELTSPFHLYRRVSTIMDDPERMRGRTQRRSGSRQRRIDEDRMRMERVLMEDQRRAEEQSRLFESQRIRSMYAQPMYPPMYPTYGPAMPPYPRNRMRSQSPVRAERRRNNYNVNRGTRSARGSSRGSNRGSLRGSVRGSSRGSNRGSVRSSSRRAPNVANRSNSN